MKQKNLNELVSIIWDYLCLHQQVDKADCILTLGSHDIRVAHRAADLYAQGLAPYVVFSGGFGRLTGDFLKSEAEMFADEAVKNGLPKDKMIIENKSTNTGENIKFSLSLLKENKLNPQTLILVTKPYMERRAYATFKKIFPEKKVVATSPLIDFDHYPYNGFTKNDIICLMLGDLQRIKIYPGKGFQVYQDIPEDVWDAYNQLLALGYSKQLIKN